METVSTKTAMICMAMVRTAMTEMVLTEMDGTKTEPCLTIMVSTKTVLISAVSKKSDCIEMELAMMITVSM